MTVSAVASEIGDTNKQTINVVCWILRLRDDEFYRQCISNKGEKIGFSESRVASIPLALKFPEKRLNLCKEITLSFKIMSIFLVSIWVYLKCSEQKYVAVKNPITVMMNRIWSH